MDLFPFVIMLTVVVVQCSSGDGGCCSLSSSSSTTYQCNILYSCSYVFVAHLSLIYTSNIWCTLRCRCYTVFVSSFMEMRGNRHYFPVLLHLLSCCTFCSTRTITTTVWHLPVVYCYKDYCGCMLTTCGENILCWIPLRACICLGRPSYIL